MLPYTKVESVLTHIVGRFSFVKTLVKEKSDDVFYLDFQLEK